MPFLGAPTMMPTNPPPELEGVKLSPQECAIYGIPFGSGAVWGNVSAPAPDPEAEVEDDVRGTQV